MLLYEYYMATMLPGRN